VKLHAIVMIFASIRIADPAPAADEAGQPAKYATEFAKRWAITRKLAVGVAEAMPTVQYAFKPDPASMTFGEQMAHLAWANYAFCAGLKDTPTPAIPQDVTKGGLVKLLGESFDYCSAVISNRSEQQLDQIHSSPDGKLNGRELLLALYAHMAHHRGQAEVYLRDKGIAPPPYVF
jgi:uncharacterized damage-inducible protein DinB